MIKVEKQCLEPKPSLVYFNGKKSQRCHQLKSITDNSLKKPLSWSEVLKKVLKFQRFKSSKSEKSPHFSKRDSSRHPGGVLARMSRQIALIRTFNESE